MDKSKPKIYNQYRSQRKMFAKESLLKKAH